MQLYGSYTSPFVRHVRIALLETGLACEFIETDADASAKLSPTQKVPLLKDGDLTLTDSAAILKYIREKSGQAFMPDIKDYELFCLANAVLEATVNIFMLKKFDDLEVSDSHYLQRQQARIETGLAELNQFAFSKQAPFSEAELRLVCLLDWALYRQRFTIQGFERLTELLANAYGYQHFSSTQPPQMA